MKPCLGDYQVQGDRCYGCPVALLCIDITIAADQHWDSLDERQREIEEMEADASWQEVSYAK